MKLVGVVEVGGIFPLSHPEVSIETLGVVMEKTPLKHTKHTTGGRDEQPTPRHPYPASARFGSYTSHRTALMRLALRGTISYIQH